MEKELKYEKKLGKAASTKDAGVVKLVFGKAQGLDLCTVTAVAVSGQVFCFRFAFCYLFVDHDLQRFLEASTALVLESQFLSL